MTKKIFIFAHFGLNISHSFLYFVTLKGYVFVIGKIILAALLRENSKTNIKNPNKIVTFWKKLKINSDMIFLPYCPPLLWLLE